MLKVILCCIVRSWLAWASYLRLSLKQKGKERRKRRREGRRNREGEKRREGGKERKLRATGSGGTRL